MKASPSTVCLALISLLTVSPPNIQAADFQGADAVLQRVAALVSNAPGSAPSLDPVQQWRAEVNAYGARVSGFSPDDAAHGWLDLFDRACRLPGPLSDDVGSSTVPHLTELFHALPPPADWAALAATVARRPPPAKGSADLSLPVLGIVTGALQDDAGAIDRAIATFRQEASTEEDSQQKSQDLETADRLRDVFHQATVDTVGKLLDFEATLALVNSRDASSKATAARQNACSSLLEVPDLVALVGPAEAEVRLRQVFAAPFTAVAIRDEPTQALARTVALSMGDGLKCALWPLVNGPDAVALYELLDRRFPETDDNRGERAPAKPSYLVGLIVQGREQEAVAFALKLAAESAEGAGEWLNPAQAVFDEAAVRGQAPALWTFFDHLLDAHPDLPFWPSDYAAAAAAGQTAAFLTHLQAATANPSLTPRARHELRRIQAAALLVADRLPEAIPVLRELAASDVSVADANSVADALAFNNLTPTTNALVLAQLAERLHDNALRREQLDHLANTFRAVLAAPMDPDNVFTPLNTQLNAPFVEAGRGPEIESLLLTNLERSVRSAARRRAQLPPAALDDSGVFEDRTALEALVDLYFQAGRWADIVALLDRAPYWEAGDVAGLINPATTAFGGQIARALKETGHPEGALRVVNACLDQAGGDNLDLAYALLLELLPSEQAQARLDVLARLAPPYPQPPFYQAILQLRQGRLDAAEKSVRLALALDPLDDGGGLAERANARATLGDILERRGDTAGADAARRSAQAGRLGLEANGWSDLGVITRAAQLYEQAASLCPEDYFLQQRCAVVLAALSRSDKATAYQERADTLLATTPGQIVLPHPGQTAGFETEPARLVAERVFGQIVAREPSNPRVHTLLGALRTAQERSVEAAREYREAVRLDPDDLSAWNQLAAPENDPADRNAAVINLLRLDPRHLRTNLEISGVNDLRALWPALAAASARQVPAPADLYPLAASKKAAAWLRQPQPPPGPTEAADAAATGLRAEILDLVPPPWAAVLRHPVIGAALQTLRPPDTGDSP